MNINDPFGRLEGQRQRDYESLKQTLRNIGISNRADALDLKKKLHKRAMVGLMIVTPVAVLLAILFPDFLLVSLSLGALIGAWLVNTSRRGQQFVQRFIDEELSGNGSSEPF
ncbi:MAG: hypothetical protein V7707_11105 [Motiliproteus sp.]